MARILLNRRSNGIYHNWDDITFRREWAKNRFENLIGSHLLKACHCWTDMGEGNFGLFYLRNKEKQEIDFLIVRDGKPWLPVEVKTGSITPSPNWKKLLPQLPCKLAIQVCLQTGAWDIHTQGDRKLIVVSADEFLRYLP